MPRSLADVNVWFALAVEEHQHHAAARAWWEAAPDLIGFVRLTQLGLLRLLTSAAAMRGQPLSNAEAWGVYDAFLSDSRVRVFAELPALDERFREYSSRSHPSPKVWVDAYLAAHAAASDAVLVSFDQTVTQYGAPCRILA